MGQRGHSDRSSATQPHTQQAAMHCVFCLLFDHNQHYLFQQLCAIVGSEPDGLAFAPYVHQWYCGCIIQSNNSAVLGKKEVLDSIARKSRVRMTCNWDVPLFWATLPSMHKSRVTVCIVPKPGLNTDVHYLGIKSSFGMRSSTLSMAYCE